MSTNSHLPIPVSPKLFFLVTLLSLAVSAPAMADHQVFIQSTAKSPVMLVTDIDALYLAEGAVADIPGRVDINFDPGYDDGDHMAIDSVGGRIFVTDHNSDFAVFDFALNLLNPTWGISLSEPLGLAVLPNGKILITDEEDYGGSGQEGLYRLNANLSLNATASGTTSSLFDGAEGLAYDAINDRVYVADEDDEDIEIFVASTLAYVGTTSVPARSDGPYWLAVDGSSNRLFTLSDSILTASGEYGIHVYDISDGGDTLTFNQTLVGSNGGNSDCIGSIAVSESRNRLFAVDDCANLVLVYDTASLAPLAPVPGNRTGSQPVMVAVGHLQPPTDIPTLSQWGMMLLIAVLALVGFAGIRRLRAVMLR